MLEEKWPVLVRHEKAAEWLQTWSDLVRAARTIDAYGRGLAEYLLMCEREQIESDSTRMPSRRSKPSTCTSAKCGRSKSRL
jgi:hypothetical protein